MLKDLGNALDEAKFGHQRTLNLRETLPSADQARARAEAWLRMHQVMRSESVLVITGRGNQSIDGLGVIKETITALLHSLRRRGVVKSWAEHNPGSVVVTLAPVSTLLGTPKRNRVEESNDQHQPAAQLLAVQYELELALPIAGFGIADRFPMPAVPQEHGAGAVLLGRNDALEVTVFERVILDVHREPLVRRVEARSLRDGPTQQDAVQLESEVVVKVRGSVLLDDEDRLARATPAYATRRLGRRLEIALFSIESSAILIPASMFRRCDGKAMARC